MMLNRILIKNEDLHPNLKNKVEDLINLRDSRLNSTLKGAVYGLFAGLSSGVSTVFINEKVAEHYPEFAAGGALVGGALSYKKNSKEVANLTKEVGKTISTLTYLDKNDKINVKKYRETHPIALIKRNGDIVLVKKNLFQKAVIKSQKTFAKGVGRKRINY